MDTSGNTLELCIDIQQKVDQSVTSMYQDWLAEVKNRSIFFKLYAIIYTIVSLGIIFSLSRNMNWQEINYPIIFTLIILSILAIPFYNLIIYLKKRFNLGSISILILIKVYFICSLFSIYIILHKYGEFNIITNLANSILYSLFFTFFAWIMFGHIVNRTFFVIFLELPYSESQWIPSFEAIQIQLVQTLKDTFDKQPLSKLTNALELLHQRRESRIHHTTILSFAVAVLALLGIVISMNPSIFTQIDKFLLLFSITKQPTSGMSMTMGIVMFIGLVLVGGFISARIYYGAFLSSSTQIVLRAYLQDRQIEEAKKDAAF